MTQFDRYVGVDYSGAGTPESPQQGIRVFVSTANKPLQAASEVVSRGRSRNWSRADLTDWLLEILNQPQRSIIGIDHGFSAPERYFEAHEIERAWPSFLTDFCAHWPTALPTVRVRDVRMGIAGSGAARSGSATWRRACEKACGAKSIFHFDVPGSVAHSTHAGLPWLAQLRDNCKTPVHFWPFDGWDIPPEHSVIAEMYPSLWHRDYPQEQRTADQHDAYTLATWLQKTDAADDLERYFHPLLSAQTVRLASYEGWILGLPGE